jgi:hypothetical protein
MSACIYRSGHGNVESLHCSCNILYSRCQALEFLLLVHLRTGFLYTVSLWLPVLHYLFKDTLSEIQWEQGIWNFHNRSWLLCLSYYHTLLQVHIMPCLVYCKIVFSLPKKYSAWHSGVSLRGLYKCDCERYWPNGWGNTCQNCVHLFRS